MSILSRIVRWWQTRWPDPPEPGLLAMIVARPYRIHRYDCSNRAADYWRGLAARGIPATIVAGRTRYGTQHAVVRVESLNIPGRDCWVDCVNGGAEWACPLTDVYDVQPWEIEHLPDWQPWGWWEGLTE